MDGVGTDDLRRWSGPGELDESATHGIGLGWKECHTRRGKGKSEKLSREIVGWSSCKVVKAFVESVHSLRSVKADESRPNPHDGPEVPFRIRNPHRRGSMCLPQTCTSRKSIRSGSSSEEGTFFSAFEVTKSGWRCDMRKESMNIHNEEMLL